MTAEIAYYCEEATSYFPNHLEAKWILVGQKEARVNGPSSVLNDIVLMWLFLV